MVRDAVLGIVDATVRTLDELRARLPPGTVGSLGEVGKKVGLSTASPTAIRFLEAQGLVLRLPASGHLQNERYVWRRTGVEDIVKELDDLRAAHVQVASHFFTVAGPATLGELSSFAGLARQKATVAIAALELVAFDVDGSAEPHLMHRAMSDELPEAAAETTHLLGFIDPFVEYRSSVSRLVDDRHHAVELPQTNGKNAALRDLKALWHRSIHDAGEICGVWEFDPRSEQVVTACFERADAGRKKRIAAAADRMTILLRDTLADARTFSLDTEEKLWRRASLVRSMAG